MSPDPRDTPSSPPPEPSGQEPRTRRRLEHLAVGALLGAAAFLALGHFMARSGGT